MDAKVSSRHGVLRAASAHPPHRLTTSSPSTQTAADAPTSLCSSKLRWNASRTFSKRGAYEPSMTALTGFSYRDSGLRRCRDGEFGGTAIRGLDRLDVPADRIAGDGVLWEGHR